MESVGFTRTQSQVTEWMLQQYSLHQQTNTKRQLHKKAKQIVFNTHGEHEFSRETMSFICFLRAQKSRSAMRSPGQRWLVGNGEIGLLS